MSQCVMHLRNTSGSLGEIDDAFERYADLLEEDNSTNCSFTISNMAEVQHYQKVLEEQEEPKPLNNEENSKNEKSLMNTKIVHAFLCFSVGTSIFTLIAAIVMSHQVRENALISGIKKRIGLENMIDLNSIVFGKSEGFPPSSYSIYADNKETLDEEPVVPIIVDVPGDSSKIPTAISECLGFKQISDDKRVRSHSFRLCRTNVIF